MDSAPADLLSLEGYWVEPAPAPAPPIAVKVVIAGGFGVGKTTFVGAVSEIEPLTTEAVMTDMSVGIDDTSLIADKTTTTVAMDFGRLGIDEQMVLYVFGTPGQERFWFMWDDIARGAVGAVVLIDVRRINQAFAAIDWFEHRGLPFVVGVNRFPDAAEYEDDSLREALSLGADVPIVRLDARDTRSCTDAMIRLVEHALTLAPS